MNYYLIDHLSSRSAKLSLTHPSKITSKVPKFASKEDFRE